MWFFWRRRRKSRSKAPAVDIEDALTRALAEQGIQEGFRETIRRLIYEESDSWRRCCGSGCEPCVLQMERAVDDVRRAIHWRPGSDAPTA